MDPASATTYRYDVALSYAGEDRSYVEQVACALRDDAVRVFYDRFEQVDLWGKDLGDHLDLIYRVQSRFCVMFISAAYAAKVWTDHERKSALARAIEQREAEYLLPARFDDTELPGLRPTVKYEDLRGQTPDEFAKFIVAKVKGQHAAPTPLPAFRVPRLAGSNFNPYEAAITFMAQVCQEIQRRCAALSHFGVSVSNLGHGHHYDLRVIASGVTAYSFNMRIDDQMGEGTILFHSGHGVVSGDAFNSSGKMQPSAEHGSPVLMHFDPMQGDTEVTAPEFIDSVWDEVCEAIEHQQGGSRR